MASSPKKYSSDFKAKVALEAIKGQKTINEISSEYGVHSTQITQVARSKHSMNCRRSLHDQDRSEPKVKKH
jgi:transposase-like protein